MKFLDGLAGIFKDTLGRPSAVNVSFLATVGVTLGGVTLASVQAKIPVAIPASWTELVGMLLAGVVGHGVVNVAHAKVTGAVVGAPLGASADVGLEVDPVAPPPPPAPPKAVLPEGQ